MINEIRTLLRNRVAASADGSEYVPEDYQPVQFSKPAEDVRKILGFSTDHTEASTNFLLAGYMPIVHQPDLVDIFSRFDPRITYDPRSEYWMGRLANNPAWSLNYYGAATYANLKPEASLSDPKTSFDGKIIKEFYVNFHSATEVQIVSSAGPRIQSVSFDSTGTSSWMWLEEPYLQLRLLGLASAVLPFGFSFKLTALYNAYWNQASVLPALNDLRRQFQVWSNDLKFSAAFDMFTNGLSAHEKIGAAIALLCEKMKNELKILQG